MSEISVMSEKAGKDILKNCFQRLEKEKKPISIKRILDVIGTVREYLNKSQLEKLYLYQHTRSLLIKEGLVYTLLGIDTNKAIDINLKLSGDKYKNIRYWSVHNLADHITANNPKVRAALWNRVNDKDVRIKKMAIEALVKRRDDGVKLLLKKQFLKAPDVFLMSGIIAFNDLELLTFLLKNLRQKIPTDNLEWLDEIENDIRQLIGKINSSSLT